MRAMNRQWDEISARWTRTLLAAWGGAMSEIRRQHDRLVSDGQWVTGPSDFLGIIDLARHETRTRVCSSGLDSDRPARALFCAVQAPRGILQLEAGTGFLGSQGGDVFEVAERSRGRPRCVG